MTVPICEYKRIAKAINTSLTLPRQVEQGEYARDRFNLTRVVQEYIQTALN